MIALIGTGSRFGDVFKLGQPCAKRSRVVQQHSSNVGRQSWFADRSCRINASQFGFALPLSNAGGSGLDGGHAAGRVSALLLALMRPCSCLTAHTLAAPPSTLFLALTRSISTGLGYRCLRVARTKFDAGLAGRVSQCMLRRRVAACGDPPGLFLSLIVSSLIRRSVTSINRLTTSGSRSQQPAGRAACRPVQDENLTAGLKRS